MASQLSLLLSQLIAEGNNFDVRARASYGLKAMGGQMVWTSFTDIINKVKDGESIVKVLREQLRQTGFFKETQKEMKFNFQQKLADTQINGLTDILVDLANSIESNGLL
jgi:hypothetical protein